VVLGLLGTVELRDFNLNLENPMTEERLPLAELLAKAGDGDEGEALLRPTAM
jgi:hypothetical protein